MDRYSYKKNNNQKESNICNEYYLNETTYEHSKSNNYICKIKGERGEQGPKGEIGLTGEQGNLSGNSIKCIYKHDENIPNSVKLIGDTEYYEDQNSIIISISNNNINISEFLKTISIGDKIKVTNNSNLNYYGLYIVNNYTDKINKLGINSIVSFGKLCINDQLIIEVIYSGIKGEKGDMGNINLNGINNDNFISLSYSRSNIINSVNTFNSYGGSWYQFYQNNIYNVNNLGYGFFLPSGFSSDTNYKFSNFIANISYDEAKYIQDNGVLDINSIYYPIGNVFSYKKGCLEGASISIISQSEYLKKTIGFRISVEKHQQSFFESNIGSWPTDNTDLKNTLNIISDDMIVSKGTRIRDNDNNGKIAIHKEIITDLNKYVDLYEGSGYDSSRNFHISNNKLILNENELICVVFTPITSDTDIDEISEHYIHNNWNQIMKLLNISVTLNISIIEK